MVTVNFAVEFFVLIFIVQGILATNLTCYQCKRTTDTECSPQDLQPCSSSHDTCVISVTKTVKDGFSIKRECGLAPCSFDDDMINKGLGMGTCDRTKKEFSCLFCCRENGCNKGNSSHIWRPSKIFVIVALLVVTFLNVARDFVPPYHKMFENT